MEALYFPLEDSEYQADTTKYDQIKDIKNVNFLKSTLGKLYGIPYDLIQSFYQSKDKKTRHFLYVKYDSYVMPSYWAIDLSTASAGNYQHVALVDPQELQNWTEKVHGFKAIDTVVDTIQNTHHIVFNDADFPNIILPQYTDRERFEQIVTGDKCSRLNINVGEGTIKNLLELIYNIPAYIETDMVIDSSINQIMCVIDYVKGPKTAKINIKYNPAIKLLTDNDYQQTQATYEDYYGDIDKQTLDSSLWSSYRIKTYKKLVMDKANQDILCVYDDLLHINEGTFTIGVHPAPPLDHRSYDRQQLAEYIQAFYIGNDIGDVEVRDDRTIKQLNLLSKKAKSCKLEGGMVIGADVSIQAQIGDMFQNRSVQEGLAILTYFNTQLVLNQLDKSVTYEGRKNLVENLLKFVKINIVGVDKFDSIDGVNSAIVAFCLYLSPKTIGDVNKIADMGDWERIKYIVECRHALMNTIRLNKVYDELKRFDLVDAFNISCNENLNINFPAQIRPQYCGFQDIFCSADTDERAKRDQLIKSFVWSQKRLQFYVNNTQQFHSVYKKGNKYYYLHAPLPMLNGSVQVQQRPVLNPQTAYFYNNARYSRLMPDLTNLSDIVKEALSYHNQYPPKYINRENILPDPTDYDIAISKQADKKLPEQKKPQRSVGWRGRGGDDALFN